MNFKRIIYALLYCEGEFYLSRNFSLQRVGDLNWLKNNFGFGETCDFIDELMIINVSRNPNAQDSNRFFEDINKLREKIFVPITLGGGIRNFNDAKKCVDNGADKILINYLAHKDIKTCEKISDIYGEQALSIMVDYRRENKNINTYIKNGKIYSKTLKEFTESVAKIKFGELILNSIDKDGTAAGLDMHIYKEIPKNFENPILLMGGAGKPEHFTEVLYIEKISGVITANLFNFLGKGLEQARNFSINKKVRLSKFEGMQK